jgi:hypothetical protein
MGAWEEYPFPIYRSHPLSALFLDQENKAIHCQTQRVKTLKTGMKHFRQHSTHDTIHIRMTNKKVNIVGE